MYDVVVIGAGPGGAFTAKLLAEAGYDVILIERQQIPRNKPCAGWITPKVLDLLNLHESALECCQPINGTVLWITENNKLTPFVTKYRKPISYGIQRIEFDTAIVNQAKDAGAEVVDSTFITNVYRQKKAVFVQAKNNQEFKGKFIIGADGTHSTVAKSLWMRRSWKPTELIQSVVSETIVGDIAKNLTPYYGYPELFLNIQAASYSWFFTKTQFVNLGIGVQLSKISPTCNTKMLYNEHLKTLKTINHLQGIQRLASIQAHTYPVYCGPYHYPTYGDRVILIGDAGGFPINFTGEGIRTALLTGKFAAETLIDALEYEHKNLTGYYTKWSKTLRNEYIMGDLLQMFISPSYFPMLKSIFIEESRFRKLFFDLFFTQITPHEALQRLLLYSPLITYRFLRYTSASLLQDFTRLFNV